MKLSTNYRLSILKESKSEFAKLFKDGDIVRCNDVDGQLKVYVNGKMTTGTWNKQRLNLFRENYQLTPTPDAQNKSLITKAREWAEEKFDVNTHFLTDDEIYQEMYDGLTSYKAVVKLLRKYELLTD